MTLSKVRIGDFVKKYGKKCGIPNLTVNDVSGISKYKEFFTPSRQVGADTSDYKIVPPGFYACNLMHVGRDIVLPVAVNRTNQDLIVTKAYTVFCISSEKYILSDYFYMLLNSIERDRFFWFHTDSSIRGDLDWQVFCNLEFELPKIEIQQKYVNIYRGIQNNYTVLSRKTEQLQRACICCMKSLIKSVPKRAIGEFLEQTNITNENLDYGIDDVRGISTSKEFIPTKADLTGVSLNNYKIVNPGKFAYVPDTSRRGDKISLTYNNTPQSYLVSSITNVFEVKNEKKKELLPDYLFLFLRRPEFDRYARYNSWGSAREVISWEDLGRLEIPIPTIDVQQSLVNLFKAFSKTRALSERLDKILKVICPILVRGAISEGQH